MRTEQEWSWHLRRWLELTEQRTQTAQLLTTSTYIFGRFRPRCFGWTWFCHTYPRFTILMYIFGTMQWMSDADRYVSLHNFIPASLFQTSCFPSCSTSWEFCRSQRRRDGQGATTYTSRNRYRRHYSVTKDILHYLKFSKVYLLVYVCVKMLRKF